MKETPIGLCAQAAGFLHAAKSICDDIGCPEANCLLPYYHLVCTSIELSLKALLLKDGVGVEALRRNFGHGLSTAIGEIERRELAKSVTPYDCSIIRMMSSDYKHRKYAYRLGGYSYSLGLPPIPMEVAERVHEVALGLVRRS